jgi:hypothetical protein
MMEKYNVEYPLQSSFIHAKIKQTFIQKIGYEYPLLCPKVREIFKKKVFDKYGVDSYFKTDEFVFNYPIYWQRSRETCLDKYGVEYPIQHPEIFSKCQQSTFSSKKYTFPNGRICYIRGYEPRCIDILLKNKEYDQDDIIVETVDIPVISYTKLKKDEITEQSAKYFPDILLPDKLIEIKSTYTYNKDLENNRRKFEACVNQGYNIDVWIFDEKNLIEIQHHYKNKSGTEKHTIYESEEHTFFEY